MCNADCVTQWCGDSDMVTKVMGLNIVQKNKLFADKLLCIVLVNKVFHGLDITVVGYFLFLWLK